MKKYVTISCEDFQSDCKDETMTVRELIEILNDFEPDAPVYGASTENGFCSLSEDDISENKQDENDDYNDEDYDDEKYPNEEDEYQEWDENSDENFSW